MFVVVATKADDGAVQGGLISRLLLHDLDQRLAVVAFRLFLNAIKKISDISFHEMLPLFSNSVGFTIREADSGRHLFENKKTQQNRDSRRARSRFGAQSGIVVPKQGLRQTMPIRRFPVPFS